MDIVNYCALNSIRNMCECIFLVDIKEENIKGHTLIKNLNNYMHS